MAEDLMQRISKGEFGVDGRIPTETQLIGQYKISATTARTAVAYLGRLGITETRHGSGTYVVHRRVLRINATQTEDLDHRDGVTSQDSWSTDVLAADRVPSQDFECLIVPASEQYARLFEVEVDSPLVLRRCWRSVDGCAASIESGYYPPLVTGALPRLALPHDIDQGTTSYMAENGYPMLWHQDLISARPPRPEEINFFRPPVSVSILVRLRISYADRGERVLRIMETAYRSDLHEIVYDVAGRGNSHPVDQETA
ncbi:MAG: GntR family transcriptional regulator [Micromonosporaceae bacterium]|nr:GntR family transcriptional regulator [Micromonosporaceae bacterium]